MLLIQNGLVHAMTGGKPRRADILVDNDRILRVERRIDPTDMKPETVMDASGWHICPGLVDAHAHLANAGDRYPEDADALMDAALAAGVTTVAVWPEEHGAACSVRHGREQAMGGHSLRLLRAEALDDTTLRATMLSAAQGGQRLACEVYRLESIRRVLSLRRETGCKLVLAHVGGGSEAAEELAEADCPVILGGGSPRQGESPYELAARLWRLGMVVALTADHPTTRLHHLPLCAGLCVRAGVPALAAMAMITLNPAILLGLDSVCGTIEPGKRADLTLYDGDPLMLHTTHVMTICAGRVMSREPEMVF